MRWASTGSLIKTGTGTLTLTSRYYGHSMSGGITVNQGTLVLSGPNTFIGGVTLNAGQLNVNNATALASAP